MSQVEYIFHNSQDQEELERLRVVEAVFDPASRRRLLEVGLKAGWRCLEVGAGAGSIMKWMGEVVGRDGKIVAVDINPRFVANSGLPNVEVLRADIRNIELASQFDLVHARHVLIHVPDFEVALGKMLDCLKPEGWIVIEEPDFSAARAIAGNAADCQSVNRVNQAIFRMFSSMGMDYSLGVKLPHVLQKLGLKRLSVENEAHLSGGGSAVARIMKMSTLQLSEKYIATGEATRADLERYCRFAENPDSWAVYSATVGVTGQK